MAQDTHREPQEDLDRLRDLLYERIGDREDLLAWLRTLPGGPELIGRGALTEREREPLLEQAHRQIKYDAALMKAALTSLPTWRDKTPVPVPVPEEPDRRWLLGAAALASVALLGWAGWRWLGPRPGGARLPLTVVSFSLARAEAEAPGVDDEALTRVLTAIIDQRPRAVVLDMVVPAAEDARGKAVAGLIQAAHALNPRVPVVALLPSSTSSWDPRQPSMGSCKKNPEPCLDQRVALPAQLDASDASLVTLGAVVSPCVGETPSLPLAMAQLAGLAPEGCPEAGPALALPEDLCMAPFTLLPALTLLDPSAATWRDPLRGVAVPDCALQGDSLRDRVVLLSDPDHRAEPVRLGSGDTVLREIALASQAASLATAGEGTR